MTSADLESRVRATLVEHARQAPPGAPLADRILAELDVPVLRPRHGWRTRTFPLLAAAAIAAVALAVVGVGDLRFGAAPERSGRAATRPAPSPHRRPQLSATPTVHALPLVAAPVRGVAGLRGFRATDATYYGEQDAWALGSARCSARSSRTCAALAATTDGGRSWHREALPAGVTAPGSTCGPGCVQGIRFANDRTGYLFGPQAFWTTSDGTTWTRQAGGAVALETLDGTVIRVDRTDETCRGRCAYRVSFAPVGAATWTPAAGLPPLTGDTVQLVRARSTAYLLVRDGTAGRLFHSGSGGAGWTPVPGCAGLRSVALGRGSLDLVCGNHLLVGAGTPAAHRVELPGGGSGVQVSAAGPSTLLAAGDMLYRSTDSGVSWQLALPHPADPVLGPPGFQTEKLGRWLTDGGRSIWTTVDGGRTWSGLAFSR